ncbi:MAG: hypothetical protein ABSA16_00475 [Thermoguttaceae bacterium]
MNTIHLLPCSCGRKIPVQLRQAGEIVKCECGTSLEVPTLTGTKALQSVETTAEPQIARTAWTTGHRLTFFGGLVILAAIAIGGWLFWTRPVDPYANFTPEQMIQTAETLTPMQSLRFWQMLERGGLEYHKHGADIVFADLKAQHQIYWWLVAIVAGTGLALVAAGIIVLNLRKKKPREAARE